MTLLIELIGWLGALFTLGAYSSRTMLPLRTAAVLANLAGIGYGAGLELWPHLVLHAVLLPLNLWRIWQILSLRSRAKAAATAPSDFDWIAKVQAAERQTAGTTLFSVGDSADYIYYLKSGRVHLAEPDKTLNSGALFGEIAFFSATRTRTASATCLTDCEIVRLDEKRFMAAFHQDPAFGLAIVRLVAGRLIENGERPLLAGDAALGDA